MGIEFRQGKNMAEQQTAAEWSQSVKTRMHIFGYIGAFIFLFLEGSKLSYAPAQATGYYFLVAAFLILIGQLPFVILKRIAQFADGMSTVPMYIVAMAGIIKGGIELINATGQVRPAPKKDTTS
jgi:H+/Cl- antiporter ClcA